MAADETEDDVPLNVRVPRSLHTRLKVRAAMTGRTIRQYVADAIRAQVERDEATDT